MGAWKVRIELTPDQREHLRRNGGRDVRSLSVEILEDRAAPTIFGAPDPIAEGDLRIVPED